MVGGQMAATECQSEMQEAFFIREQVEVGDS